MLFISHRGKRAPCICVLPPRLVPMLRCVVVTLNAILPSGESWQRAEFTAITADNSEAASGMTAGELLNRSHVPRPALRLALAEPRGERALTSRARQSLCARRPLQPCCAKGRLPSSVQRRLAQA